MSLLVSAAERWFTRKIVPPGKEWVRRNLSPQGARETLEGLRAASDLLRYVGPHLRLTHGEIPRLDASSASQDSSADKIEPVSIITINLGFCGAQPIDSNLHAPTIINARLYQKLLATGRWGELTGSIRWVQAPTVFYPRVFQRYEPGQLKYWSTFLLNYLLSYRPVIKGVLKMGRRPIIIGGDHSIGFATHSTINDFYLNRTGKPIGLIWIDAHPDINTRWTTTSGNIHGWLVAGLLGLSSPFDLPLARFMTHPIRPQNLVYIATRDIEPAEQRIIEELGIKSFSAEEIGSRGVKTVMGEAREIAGQGTSGISVSFDIDGLEGKYVPGTGTPVHHKGTAEKGLRGSYVERRGLTPDEAYQIAREIHGWGNLVSFEIAEVNPEKDGDGFPTVEHAAEILKQVVVGE